ncbi:hypothetical protein, partial [uncultured Oscillibacter sp.]|uniref:hypothetical protein n=1 Tax=uncultured Oscillibacter sp. TaxID=876091 RepID=UPI0026027B95
HRLVAVKIARKFHIRHGRCLLLGMKKARLSNRAFFWMFDFVTKVCFFGDCLIILRFLSCSLSGTT